MTRRANSLRADLRLLRHTVALPVVLVLPACSPATSQDVAGSFFPSWLLCIGIGIALAIGIRQVLVLTEVSNYVFMPVLTYFAVAAAASMLVWLFWFGH
jgi:hypothetical protein